MINFKTREKRGRNEISPEVGSSIECASSSELPSTQFDDSLGVKNRRLQHDSEPTDYERSLIRLMWHRLNPLRKNPRHLNLNSRYGLYGIPNTIDNVPIPKMLLQPHYQKILHTIFNICSDKSGPYVIPIIIDHWTTFNNLKSIIGSGSFLGQAYLSKKQMTFKANSFGGWGDWVNLDHNVICFSPGGFVDPAALKGENRVRVRINLNNINLPGTYNQFFKVTDFLFYDYEIACQLTGELSISFSNIRNAVHVLSFTFNGIQKHVSLTTSELVYYGNIAGINRFCLLLPFIALEKLLKGDEQSEGDIDFVLSILDHLASLEENELRKILISLSQNITMFSEYNFYCKLPLSNHLIYDIHDASSGVTYSLAELEAFQYDMSLERLHDSESIEAALHDLPQKRENILRFDDFNVNLYNLRYTYGHKEYYAGNEFNTDVRKIPNHLFQNGYVETRIGNRTLPIITYGNNISTRDAEHPETRRSRCSVSRCVLL